MSDPDHVQRMMREFERRLEEEKRWREEEIRRLEEETRRREEEKRWREEETRQREEETRRREEAEKLVRGTTLSEYLRNCHSLVFKALQIAHKSVTSTRFA